MRPPHPGVLWARCGATWPPTGKEEDGDAEPRSELGRVAEALRCGGRGPGVAVRDLAVRWASANGRPRRALAGGAPPGA